MKALLRQLRREQHIGAADYHLGLFLLAHKPDEGGEAALLGALATAAVHRGDTCLQLDDLAQGAGPLAALLRAHDQDPASLIDRARLSALVACAEDGDGEDPRPLIWHDARLYLRRYWQHERQVVEQISQRAAWVSDAMDRAWLARRLDDLFGHAPLSAGQRRAAATALLRLLCVITGGPGTGKTYSVARLLTLHVEHALRQGRQPPSIALLAPTGKAAARLSESVQQALSALGLAGSEISASIPAAATIHRALGSVGGSSTRFRHGARDPLPADLVVVDEASMIDLGLMARLLAAVDRRAHLILLGDKEQLASVEAGAVLGDICQAGLALPWSRNHQGALRQLGCDLTSDDRDSAAAAAHPTVASPSLRDCIVELRHSRRYDPAGGVGLLARAIQAGQGQRVVEIAGDPKQDDVRLLPLDEDTPLSGDLRHALAEGYRHSMQIDDPSARLRALASFRVLCAHRVGRAGSLTLNAAIEHDFQKRGWLRLDEASYPGRPILITCNDHALRLYNGDVGVCLHEPGALSRPRPLLAYFAGSDGELRALAPGVLPAHETVFAMTVHKSQGSEYDHVAVVLGSQLSPVMTRELLYTAVTRAKRSVQIFTSPQVLRACVEQRIQRASGLAQGLLSAQSEGDAAWRR